MSEGHSIMEKAYSNGAELSLDRVLFAALEHEKMVASGKANGVSFPELDHHDDEDLLEDLKSQSMADLQGDLCSWYSANYPILKGSHPWNFEGLEEVSKALTGLVADLGLVYQIKNDEEHPEYIAEKADTDSYWQSVQALISKTFQMKAGEILSFIYWSYSKEREDPAKFKLMPPVGKYASRGYRQKMGRDSNQSQNRNFRGNGKKPRPKQQKNKRRSPEADEALKAKVLADCNAAIASLEKDASLTNISLKPQNSFYRRLQHQEISDKGYLSSSTGEGKERCVIIFRGDQE